MTQECSTLLLLREINNHKDLSQEIWPKLEGHSLLSKGKTGNASENYVDAEFWARVSQNFVLSKSACSAHQLKVLILLVCKSPLF